MNVYLVILILSINTFICIESNPKVVCYYESWAYWKEGNGKMTVNDIDSSLCTHIVYAYLGITNALTVDILDPYLMETLNDLSNFSKIKGKAKAMIAIGGSSQSSKYSSVAASDSSRATFVNSVFTLINRYQFDGIMIDWQYPQQADMANYVKLLDKFDEKFSGTSLILGITGAPYKETIDNGFDVPKINNYVDFVHVLAYDYHGPWDSRVYFAAPLPEQINSLTYWNQKGVPKDKLVPSNPFFARTFRLAKAEDNEIEAHSSGPGSPGPYTQTAGMMGYNELCTLMRSNPNQFLIRRSTKEPGIYAVYNQDWISYEDSKTLADKAKSYIQSGYGGMAVYSINSDDFKGLCGTTKFPLLRAVDAAINGR